MKIKLNKKRTPFTTKEVIQLLTSNFRDKLVTCNKCGNEFVSRRKDDSRIRCNKCGSNESLSISYYEDCPYSRKTLEKILRKHSDPIGAAVELMDKNITESLSAGIKLWEWFH